MMGITTPDLDSSLEFLGLFAAETEDVILARCRDWANDGLDPVADAEKWTDTQEGGHWHMGVIQCVREFARLYDLAGTEVPMSAFVLWAWGTYLDDLAAVWHVYRLVATPAIGIVTFSGPAGVVIGLNTTVGVDPATADDPAPTFSTQDAGTIPDEGGGVGTLDLPIRATEAGAAGDVAAGAITVPGTPLPDGVTFSNASATSDGSDPETDAALRVRVLQVTEGEGPGNQLDIARWARAWPGVGSAKVVPVWNGPNSALVVIGDQDGQPVSADLVAALQADLDPEPGLGAGTAPVGQQLTVDTPDLLTVNVTADVSYETGYSANGAGGTTALSPMIAPLIAAYLPTVLPGGQAIRAHVAGLIATFPGVLDVSNVRLNGAAANLNVSIGPPPQVAVLGTLTI